MKIKIIIALIVLGNSFLIQSAAAAAARDPQAEQYERYEALGLFGPQRMKVLATLSAEERSAFLTYEYEKYEKLGLFGPERKKLIMTLSAQGQHAFLLYECQNYDFIQTKAKNFSRKRKSEAHSLEEEPTAKHIKHQQAEIDEAVCASLNIPMQWQQCSQAVQDVLRASHQKQALRKREERDRAYAERRAAEERRAVEAAARDRERETRAREARDRAIEEIIIVNERHGIRLEQQRVEHEEQLAREKKTFDSCEELSLEEDMEYFALNPCTEGELLREQQAEIDKARENLRKCQELGKDVGLVSLPYREAKIRERYARLIAFLKAQ